MKSLLLTAGLAYAAYAALMIALHPRFIYPFQPDSSVLPGFDRVELTAQDGTPISVQERPGPGPIVLYFMGNAGALPFFGPAFEPHIAAGRHIIALEYRGGAGRPGTPTERRLKADALVVADYAATFNKPLIVQGFSLGTGLALHVAARRAVDRVVLTAPYDRLCRIMAARAWLPACVLPFVQSWPAIEDARRVEAPIIVLHGDQDALIPPARSAPFSELSTVSRVVISGAGHNDIADFSAYRDALTAFLRPQSDPQFP